MFKVNHTTTVCKVHPTCNPASPAYDPQTSTCDPSRSHLRRMPNPLAGSAAHFVHKIRTAPTTGDHVTIQNGHRATTPAPVCAQNLHRATTGDHITIQNGHRATTPAPLCSQNSHRATTGDHVTIQNCHRATRAHSIITSSSRRENNLF